MTPLPSPGAAIGLCASLSAASSTPLPHSFFCRPPSPPPKELHIIIFDEIDAICKTRGTVRDGTATHDTIVNQLLTKIDGVDALNNILLIGGRCRFGSRFGFGGFLLGAC